MRLDWDTAGALVAEAQSVVVLTHVGPDGDAIGSMCGLAQALQNQGKRVLMAVDEGVPADLRFLPGADTVCASLKGPDLEGFDLVIAVDCGDEPRMGQVGQVALQSGLPLINLDHHRTNTLFGQANLVDLSTVAAAEGVLDWLDRMGFALDQAIATSLLTGMVTDTLCFRTDNVTDALFGKVQRLMALGAPLSDIVQRTVDNKSYAGLQLWAQVLPTVRLEDHVIWAVITQDMFRAIGYPGHDDAGLVGMLRQTEGAYISAVFKEKPDGKVEIGFRAVPDFDTAAIAVSLGGGGHKLASGATVPEPLATLVPRVINLLKAEVRNGHAAIEQGS